MQFRLIQNKGFKVISLSELVEGYKQKKDFPKKVVAITFDYGQPEEELKITEYLANVLGVTLEVAKLELDINRIGDAPFYPFRNAIFLATAANWMMTRTDAKTIITGLGTISSDPALGYTDTSPSFINSFLYALNMGAPDDQLINILAPISGWTKKEIFNWLVDNDFEEIIPASTSCYEDTPRKFPWGVGCNVCLNCLARKNEFLSSKANPENYKNKEKDVNGTKRKQHGISDRYNKS
jgi:7-cyano-7-deazaguanine synthase in queuosine biosynthesis